MKYLSIIICITVLYATNTNIKNDTDAMTQTISSNDSNHQTISSNDIAYNNRYQTNRGGYNAYANQSAYHLEQAGRHLKNFRSQYYTGFALTVGGQILLLAGATSEQPGTTLIGAGVSLIGVVMSFFSYNEAGKAGEELQQASRAM